MNKEFNDLKANGFTGFISVAELRKSCSEIPKVRGVYVVLRLSDEAPVFLEKGTGGFFKGKDPNVSIDKLNSKWVKESSIMYIGKAGDPDNKASLYTRIRQYIRFGEGENVGHQGGCYIWQLKDASELVFAWKILPEGFPSQMESEMIKEYKKSHDNKLPFANRTQGSK